MSRPTGIAIPRARPPSKEAFLLTKDIQLILILIIWLTFCFNDNCLAFFYKTVCKRSSLCFTGVVAIFRRVCHTDECFRAGEFVVVFVDGEPHGVIGDPLRNINGYRAGQLEMVALKYINGLQSQMWLWKQLCCERDSENQTLYSAYAFIFFNFDNRKTNVISY